VKNLENLKNLKISARQGELTLDKIRHAPNKDKCVATGMQQLNFLPTKCKAFLFDMGISMASVLLSNEVGELAKKYQA
jgi:hypothetical protein